MFLGLNRRIIRLLLLGFLVIALQFAPSLSKKISTTSNSSIQQTSGSFVTLAQTGTEQKSEERSQASQADEKEQKIDPIKMTIEFLAGLVLFLYGVTRLADGLRSIGSDRAKEIISKFTGNRFTGILIGVLCVIGFLPLIARTLQKLIPEGHFRLQTQSADNQ